MGPEQNTGLFKKKFKMESVTTMIFFEIPEVCWATIGLGNGLRAWCNQAITFTYTSCQLDL